MNSLEETYLVVASRHITEDDLAADKVGKRIAEVLNLKFKKGRVETDWALKLRLD